MLLEGKTALVTGGGRGIGEAVALALAAEGCRVAVAALEREEVEQVRERIIARGGKAWALAYDAASPDSVRAMLDEAGRAIGTLDILVNNAGIYRGLVMLADLALEEWNEVLEINLRGCFLVTREALRIMRPGGPGKIVNMASSLGERSLPAMGAYAASKAGILSLTRTLALELAPGIQVNAVAPGPVATRMTAEGFPQVAQALGLGLEELQTELLKGFPSGRPSTVEEVAEAVLFFCRPGTENITGQALRVDGGWRM